MLPRSGCRTPEGLEIRCRLVPTQLAIGDRLDVIQSAPDGGQALCVVGLLIAARYRGWVGGCPVASWEPRVVCLFPFQQSRGCRALI